MTFLRIFDSEHFVARGISCSCAIGDGHVGGTSRNTVGDFILKDSFGSAVGVASDVSKCQLLYMGWKGRGSTGGNDEGAGQGEG
jgi:hypothetical protein